MQQHSVTLVLGGVRSGKSRYAQTLASCQFASCQFASCQFASCQFASCQERVAFIATAERRDDIEMQRKIDRHIADRPTHWQTIEEPLHLSAAIAQAARTSDVILIDCLTFAVANLLEAHGENDAAIEMALAALCTVLRQPPASIILVSNEVGSGVVPAYASGRRFRDLVGEANQRVAAVAERVVLMVAGLPFPLKGILPEVSS